MIFLVQSVIYQAWKKGNNLRKAYVTNSAKIKDWNTFIIIRIAISEV